MCAILFLVLFIHFYICLKWKEMDLNNGGIGNVQYPLISDLDKSIARSYDVLLGAKNVTADEFWFFRKRKCQPSRSS